MAELRFEVDCNKVDDSYGLVLVILEEEEPEEAPCFFLVFKGPDGEQDPVEVAKRFGACHQEAMDSVGLGGEMTAEQVVTRLEDSIELAGELMVRHGFVALDADDLDEALLASLFGAEPDEQDPSRLN